MSLLMQENVDVQVDSLIAKYDEYAKEYLSHSSLEIRRVQLKMLNLYCFEKLSIWKPENMNLVDLNTIIKELLYDVPEDKRIPKTLQMLQGYITWRAAGGFSARSNRISFNHLTEFLFWCGIRLDKRDIKTLKFPKVLKTIPYSLMMHEIELIISKLKAPRRALHLALISSGMRIGECLSIVRSDMKYYDEHFFIKLRAETTKTNEEREIIISKEASAAIYETWEKALANDRIFMGHKQLNYKRESNYMQKIVEALEIGTKDCHPTLHRYRAYFYKSVTRTVDSDYAHQMMGHGAYLKTYGILSAEEKLELYLKAEEELSVADYYKKKLRDSTLQNQIAELKSKLDALNLPSK